MKKINEAAKASFSIALGTKAILVFTVLVISVLLRQASSVSSQPAPITTRGAVVAGDAGYFEAANFFHINQSPYRVKPGQWAYVNISNNAGTSKDLTVTLGNSANWRGIEQGSIATVTIAIPTNETTVIVNGTNSTKTYNYTLQQVNTTTWTNLPLNRFFNGTQDLTGITIKNFPPGNRMYRIKLENLETKAKKYSIFINSTIGAEQTILDFDPYVEGTNLNESAIWSFANHTNDTSSNTLYNLTNSGVTFAQRTIGNNTATVGVFVGVDSDYASITTSSFRCGSVTGCTIVGWFNRTSDGTYDVLYENGNTFGEGGWGGLYLDGAANRVYLEFDNGTSGGFATGTTFTTKQFQFIAFVYNASTGKEIRSPGNNLNASSTSTVVNSEQTAWRLGGSANGGAGGQSDVEMYCVRFYNATLNETHLDKLYNGGNATCAKLSDLMATGGGAVSANESEGDTAIELGINSSLTSPTKYGSQQAYVRNLTNNQTLGRFDWIASSGNQRWLINYITTGESYVRASNLTTAVYVLEITDKTSAQITDEVSKFINATKSS